MLRRLRNLFLGLVAVLLLGAGTLVVLSHVYEDEVKAGLVSALNKHLAAPVQVSGMDLTLLAHFPQAGIRLHDVLVPEVRTDGQEPDTLLHARELFLGFSLWDMFRGDYTVQQVRGAQVRAYPALDRNGAENYIIWKSDTTGTASSPIALEKVVMEDLVVRYRDHRSALEVLTHNERISLSGRFSDAGNELQLVSVTHLDHWRQGDREHLRQRDMDLRLALSFGGDDGAFRITKGEVNSDGVPLEVTMELLPTAKGDQLDLRANGLGLDLGRVLKLLPEGITGPLARYKIKGETDLAVRYSGVVQGEGPALSVGARVAKGRMQEGRTNTTFTNIRGELALDLTPKGVPSDLQVRNFSATSGSGSISGNWRSSGLKNASVKADLHASMALADLLRFAGVDTLEQVAGSLRADAVIDGRLRDITDLKAADLRNLTISGTATLRNATLKMKGLRHGVTALDADLTLQGNDATVQGLKAEVQGNPIAISGTLANLVPYLLFDDQRLAITARAGSPRIDLAAWLTEEGARKGAQDYALVLPAAIELDVQAKVDELVFEEFKATGINGHLYLKDRQLRVDPVTLNTAGGAVLGSLALDGRNTAGSYPLAINATVQGIDISELFREFQDFGQSFIGHRHLRGATKARIALDAPLSPSLAIDMDRLVCIVDITIENGRIKGHQPLIDIADHLRKNKLVSPFVDTDALREQLADVRFSRLENQIAIRNGAVHVPAMLVSSSVMDIGLSGTHGFDDRIDHHINFRLSDLFRKAGRDRDEFGPIVDDGTGMRIFLHMYGTASDPQFANDGAMAAARRKKQFQQEKQELRSILNEELGLFRKKQPDTAPATTGTQATTTRFHVEFDTDSATVKAGGQPPKEKRRGFARWTDPAKEPEAKEVIKLED